MKRSKSVCKKKENSVAIEDASLRQLQSLPKAELLVYLEKFGLPIKGKKEDLIVSILSFNKSSKEKAAIRKKISILGEDPSICQCKAIAQLKPLSARELHETIGRFAHKPFSEMSVRELGKIIRIIGPATYIDMDCASLAEIETFQKFYYPWIDFVMDYPQLRDLLDPHFIVFDFSALACGPAGPPGWAASLAARAATALPILQIQPVAGPPFNLEYFYRVNGLAADAAHAAYQFAGFMQGRHPGLRFWDFALPGPPVRW